MLQNQVSQATSASSISHRICSTSTWAAIYPVLAVHQHQSTQFTQLHKPEWSVIVLSFPAAVLQLPSGRSPGDGCQLLHLLCCPPPGPTIAQPTLPGAPQVVGKTANPGPLICPGVKLTCGLSCNIQRPPCLAQGCSRSSFCCTVEWTHRGTLSSGSSSDSTSPSNSKVLSCCSGFPV